MAFNPTTAGLWAALRDPRFAPSQRAQAVAGLGGAQPDLASAFQLGDEYGAADEDGAAPIPGMTGDSTGVSDLHPALIEMTRRAMLDDERPTREDKALALAKAGFAMAAGDSPHALQNIGRGAMIGVDALQDMRQQRALQRMRETQLQQQLVLRQAALQEQQRAAQERAGVQRDAIRQREEAAKQQSLDRQMAIDARSEAQAASRAASAQAAEALAETRYNNADLRRRESYAKTGQWSSIEGDKERGISGPPEGAAPFSGPVVDDPGIGFRERQKLLVAKPKAEQAVTTIDLALDNVTKAANDLKNHKGMSGAVGFRMGQEFIPGTDAADFAANLDSLKSKVFAQTIQAMRDASKTGGAVGNVSDREGARFESMLASLMQSQSEKQFKENLQAIIDYTAELKTSYKDAYRKTYGEIDRTEPEAGSGSDGGKAGAGSGGERQEWERDPATGKLRRK